MKDKVLLGDEAIAQGALDAGLSGVYAYPGTPSTEIMEYIQRSGEAAERKMHARWSANEKTAMEAGLVAGGESGPVPSAGLLIVHVLHRFRGTAARRRFLLFDSRRERLPLR